MEECFRLLRSKDTKERLQALSKAQALVDQLDLGEVTELADIALDLLKDNNFKVCQGMLILLTSAVANSADNFRHQLNSLLPSVVERLGDGKQPVREAGRRLLLALMEALTPALIFEKTGDTAWSHKNWRVREEFTRTCTAALSLFGQQKLPVQRLALPSVVKLLEDSNNGVREASMTCIEELYRQSGSPFLSDLQRFSIRPAQLKEITARLEQIEPLPSAPPASCLRVTTAPSTFGRFQSPNKRSATADSKESQGVQRVLTFGASQRPDSAKGASTSGRGLTDDDVARYLVATCEKPVSPIKIYSERELAKELDKAAAILVPEQDWSARMTAMQRLCGLVLGGAAELDLFPQMIKQLWEPLGTQLADRRSSIVKQACHLLMLMARELQLKFESSAEHFIPSLFKLVVITVLIIAESADSCIKTLFHFCRCYRIVPKVLESAMRDRAGVLRTKCCEYALLTLDRWQEVPEIHKAGQLYEDMIKCCVGDALSEVRASARQCYQVFVLVWPDRSRRLLSSLDPSTQKLLQEEQRNGGSKPSSPTARGKASLFKQPSGPFPRESASREGLPKELPANPLNAASARLTGTSSFGPERGAATANEGEAGGYAAGMQRRAAHSAQRREANDVVRSAGGILRSASAEDILLDAQKGGVLRGLSGPLRMAGGPIRDGHLSDDPSPAGPSSHHLGGVHLAARRVPQKHPSDSELELEDAPTSRARQMSAQRMQLPPPTPGGPPKQENAPTARASRGANLQPRSGTSSASSRSRDDVSIARRSSEQDEAYGDPWAFPEPLSLSEALASGSDPEGTWTNRVNAFQAVVTSLQQSESGGEVAGSFKKVMGLFLAHLGEQHHKVAVAALTSLAEVVKVPTCSRLFEGYLERVLPLVFARLGDSKDNIRQAALQVLDACKEAYSGDVLLQPLIRCLDEQRSIKAKASVAEFGSVALIKPPVGAGEGTWINLTLLKQWLTRLVSLTNDKNPKMKEVGARALISAFEHLDSNTVLNMLLGMQVEEQLQLRRLLQKFTPDIDADFVQIQSVRQKKYKVAPANAAASQADTKRSRPASQRSRQKKAAETSGSESDALEDTQSEQTTREDRVKQWVEVEARKALAVHAEALGARSAGKPSAGSLESSQGEQAVAELHRRLSSADQQGASTSNAVETPAGKPRSYAEIYSERKKSMSKEAQEEGASFSSPPKKQNTPRPPDPGPAKDTPTISDPGEPAKAQPPAKRTPQKAQAESSLLEKLARRNSGELNEVSLHQKVQQNGRGPEGPLNRLGNGVAVHRPDSFDSDSGSDDGWTEAGGLAYAGLQGKVLQALPDPTRNQRMAALKDVRKACKMGDTALWDKHYWHFYQVVLEAMNDEDASLKERALRVLDKMIAKHGCGSEDVVVSVVNKLVAVHRDKSASVSRSAENCLEAVLAQLEPEQSLQLLKAVSQTPENRTIVLSISMKQKVIARLSAEELEAHLPSILPELFQHFGSPFPDIRKAVVLCLVEMYMTMGNELIPHLAQLSDMQRRLVSIYAKKISETRHKEKESATVM